MLIKPEPLQHWLDNFFGYGSWHAKIWFIANEESGGDVPEEVAEKIDYFYSLRQLKPVNPASMDLNADGKQSLCDIRELYKQVAFRFDGPKAGLYSNLHEYRFDSKAVHNTVWKNLISFEYGYKGDKLPDTLDYQKHSFLSISKENEALIKLYPLPASNSHAWYYSWLDLPQFPFLKRKDLYEQHVYAHRIQTILQNIIACKPDLVLMYGMNNINTLKESFQHYFPGIKFKMVKAIKQQIPQHHRADISGTTLLITTQFPALRHNRIETGFDWEQFGESVKN